MTSPFSQLAKKGARDAPLETSLPLFDYQPRTRIIFGTGCVERVGEIAASFKARQVLLVTDPGIVAAGHCARVQDSLARAHVKATLFDQAKQNPTTKCVYDCVSIAKDAGIDLIIGLGGGSSLDTAKGCNFILTNGGKMEDYAGYGKAALPMLPMIAIPTTAGTGSECQSYALIADERSHQKMACGDPKAAAQVALLDPMLTLSLPARVTAVTGIDTIAHAVESAVTKRRNSISAMFSREAFRLAMRGFPRVLESPDDLDARADMLLAAAFGGTAIENSMLGAAHSAANPLTAHYDVIHGDAVGLMLPLVVQFNARDPVARERYAELAWTAGLARTRRSATSAVKALMETIRTLCTAAGIPGSLGVYGVGPADLPMLAEEAAQQWTAGFNPRAAGRKEFLQLYTKALEARPETAPLSAASINLFS